MVALPGLGDDRAPGRAHRRHLRPSTTSWGVSAAAGGGVLSFLAVGCRICNKIVVWLIGVSGALSFFAPVQPYLAVAGLILFTVSLVVRRWRLVRCPVPLSSPEPASTLL